MVLRVMALTGRQAICYGITAFVIWGYAIEWVPTVRWMGYAFVCGAVVSVASIAALHLLTSRGAYDARAKISWPTQLRGASFLEPKAWEAETTRLHRVYEPTPIYPLSSRISAALNDVVGMALLDFVESWYSNMSRDPGFSNEVDRAIRLALANLMDRVSHLDLVEFITTRLVPILTEHIRDFHNAEIAVRGRKLNRSVTESEELDLAIASKYRDGKLHKAASLSFPDTKLVQQEYLRLVTLRILPFVFPRSLLVSNTVSIFVREIVTCALLSPMMQVLSDPDTWNQVMENYGRSMLQDRTTVRRLRAALDQHASPTPKSDKPATIPRLSPNDSERKFEKFVRAIRRLNNLSDARLFRSEVASQLKRDLQQETQDQVYIRRLEMGKRLLDQKVHHLAAGGDRRTLAPAQLTPTTRSRSTLAASRLENADLVEVLRDSSWLSYFMEYMDRQQLMSLVQFWLVVDGFRNPLEDDGQDDEQVSATLPMWTESDQTDLRQIEQAYLSRPELKVPESSKDEIRAFLHAGKSATPLQYYKARKAVLAAQTAALEEMRLRYFDNFKKSDLFYKCLASQEASKTSTIIPPPRPENATDLPSHPGNSRASPAHQQTKLNPVSRMAPRLARSTGKGTLAVNAGLDLRTTHRGPLEEDPSNPLFQDDEGDMDGMMDSVQSLEQEIERPVPDTRVVHAMEQALSTILEADRPQTAEDLRASLFRENDDGSSRLFSTADVEAKRALNDMPYPVQQTSEPEKPSLASLGLVSSASRIGVFEDDDLFGDEDAYLSDERDDAVGISGTGISDDEVHEAAPGDLGLAEAITVLTNDIDKLVAQEAVVDSLTKKAELTNNTAELRILRKSKTSLEREIRRKGLQRQQYVMQESDNSLYGRSTIRIKSIQVGKEHDGREFALYVIEVQRDAGEQMPAAAWTVTRRYSEFHELHQKLRSIYSSVRNLDFPRRRVVMKFQSEFLRKRRLALEKYLRELLLLPEVCRSRELRAFLSQSTISRGQEFGDVVNKKDIVSRIYDSVTDGVEDILGNIPVLDQLSLAGQNLIAAATSQLNAMPLDTSEDGIVAAEAEAELNAFENKELEPFIKPICDIFLEVFELNRGNNWLRGRAVVVVLQQLLGGTIERKVREYVRLLLQEEAMLRYIGLLRESLWPRGVTDVAKTRPVRTTQQKQKSRTEASLMLATLIPDLAGSVVGRMNAQAASRRIFATLNNSRLNSHLAFTILDEIVEVLFDT